MTTKYSPKQSPNTSPKPTNVSPKLSSPVKGSHSKINERFITDPFAITPKRSDADHNKTSSQQIKRSEQDPPTLKLPPPPMSRGFGDSVCRPPALSEMLPPTTHTAGNAAADVLTEMELKRKSSSPTLSLHIVKSPAPIPAPR